MELRENVNNKRMNGYLAIDKKLTGAKYEGATSKLQFDAKSKLNRYRICKHKKLSNDRRPFKARFMNH